MKLESVTEVKIELEQTPDVPTKWKERLVPFLFELESRLKRKTANSSNSSVPPSSDDSRKRGSKGKKTEKPVGGQPGHSPAFLKPVDNPDKIISLSFSTSDLPPGVSAVDRKTVSRQVIDVEMRHVVTQYDQEVLMGSDGKRYCVAFPEGVEREVQYGNQLKSLVVTFNQYHMIPMGRCAEIVSDMFDINLSTGSVANFQSQLAKQLELFTVAVKEKLKTLELAHSDETGIQTQTENRWIHAVCSEHFTYLMLHEKRGMDAIKDMGVLEDFQGTLVHDCWRSYFSLSCEHALCGAHLVRELQGVLDSDEKQTWAKDLKELLQETVHELKDKKLTHFEPERYENLSKNYDEITAQAETQCPANERLPGQKKRGRVKQTKERNLLERLKTYKESVLMFAKKAIVPFTNNQAERDLRMAKVKQKVSGTFRSVRGAEAFCTIRSFVLTVQKQNLVNSLQAINLAFEGKWGETLQLD